jgi:hypothetical protein
MLGLISGTTSVRTAASVCIGRRVSTFTDGTLVVDAYTPDPKKMVWRGMAEESVADNPEKTTKNIAKSLDELFAMWDKIEKKQYHD